MQLFLLASSTFQSLFNAEVLSLERVLFHVVREIVKIGRETICVAIVLQCKDAEVSLGTAQVVYEIFYAVPSDCSRLG